MKTHESKKFLKELKRLQDALDKLDQSKPIEIVRDKNGKLMPVNY